MEQWIVVLRRSSTLVGFLIMFPGAPPTYRIGCRYSPCLVRAMGTSARQFGHSQQYST